MPAVLVNGMKMPDSCLVCRFLEPFAIKCYITHKFLDRDDYATERDDNCPLFYYSDLFINLQDKLCGPKKEGV